jgi:carbon-monoxide dehydrogenase large subunit
MNVLGAEGIGESATIGSTPAIQNAIIDALRPFGVTHIDLPCTPERIWRAVRNGGADPWREPPAVFDDLPLRHAGTDDESGAI